MLYVPITIHLINYLIILVIVSLIKTAEVSYIYLPHTKVVSTKLIDITLSLIERQSNKNSMTV